MTSTPTARCRELLLAGRRAEAEQAFVERCAAAGLRVRAGEHEDVAGAAVVICATSSSTPVLDDRLVPDDAVVAAIGAHGLDCAELPPDLIRRSDITVEGRASAMRPPPRSARACFR